MKKTQERDKRALRFLRGAMVAIALTLPLLSLAGFGIWWLWENDFIIAWSVTATAIALAIYALEAFLIWRTGKRDKTIDPAADEESVDRAPVDAGVHPPVPIREQNALNAVEELAAEVDPEILVSRESILQAGIDTLETVAKHMHPSEKEPLWKFTVPEALAVIEQVSRQVSKFVVNTVPLGERITVGQLLTVYRWRSLVGMAERAYDLWRILRFVNPASAVAGELREKVSGQFIDGMRSELMRRVARAYIREVGHAAIDLYSGRLRPVVTGSDDLQKAATAIDQLVERPLTILVIGQRGVGATGVIAALATEMDALIETEGSRDETRTTIFKQKNGDFSAVIVEPPALADSKELIDQIVKRAVNCDIVLAVVSAVRPDRAMDTQILDAVRTELTALTDRTLPPIAVVLTDVEKLRPFKEWSPPYDLNEPVSEKAREIRNAVEAVAEDLQVETDDVIPVVTVPDQAPYNVDALVAEIIELVPEARRAQVTRQLASSAKSSLSWKHVWRQTLNAGKVLARSAARAATDKVK